MPNLKYLGLGCAPSMFEDVNDIPTFEVHGRVYVIDESTGIVFDGEVLCVRAPDRQTLIADVAEFLSEFPDA